MRKGVDYIKMDDLENGYLYRIIARNARLGIWYEDHRSFLISRFKFGSNFLFEEFHWDCPAFATARPLEKLEKSPFDLSEGCSGIEPEIIKYLNAKSGPYGYY